MPWRKGVALGENKIEEKISKTALVALDKMTWRRQSHHSEQRNRNIMAAAYSRRIKALGEKMAWASGVA